MAVSHASDGYNGFNTLNGASGVSTFTVRDSTYAIVASMYDYGVQLIDVSNPTSPVAVGAATDGSNGFDELDGARRVSTFTLADGSVYAIVASLNDDGVQLMRLTEEC